MVYLLKILSFVLTYSPNFILWGLGQFLTFLCYDLFGLRKKVVLENLRIALGSQKTETELKKIGRISFFNTVLNFLELLGSADGSLSSQVEISQETNLEIIRNSLAQQNGKGIYVISIHMGNWEVFGSILGRIVAPALAITKKVGSDSVNNWLRNLRKLNHIGTVDRQKKGDGYKAILDCLEKGAIIGLMQDQSRPNSPYLDFFGHPAKTNTSFAAIALKNPAPIIPGYCFRTGIRRHKLVMLPEFKLKVTGDMEKDILENTQELNRLVEKIILAHYEQYFWVHRRWK